MKTGVTSARTRTVSWEDPAPGFAQAAKMTGLEYIRAIFERRLPSPPMAELMGFAGSEAEEGRSVFTSEPGEFLYNPIGVVHGGTKIIDLDPVVRPKEEHARHRRKTGMVESDARIDGHFHVEGRGAARPYREAIGRCGTFAVEQGVHDDGIGVHGRLLDPERLERGEFLPFGFAGVNRQTPR